MKKNRIPNERILLVSRVIILSGGRRHDKGTRIILLSRGSFLVGTISYTHKKKHCALITDFTYVLYGMPGLCKTHSTLDVW